MRRFIVYITAILCITQFLPALTAAQEMPASTLLISQLQVASTTSASEEFIELHNTTQSYIDCNDWKIEYKAAAATSSWFVRATLNGWVEPQSFILLTADTYMVESSDFQFASGLAASAGHIRLLNEKGEVIDTVAWGATASSPETSPAPAPPAGQSINRVLADTGEMIDSDNNAQDFVVTELPILHFGGVIFENPNPEEVTEEPVEQVEDESEVDPETETEVSPEEVVEEKIYLPLQITEVLPDPVSPLLDSEDEWVELFNPNDTIVELRGYVLQTGNSFSYSYEFIDEQIAPKTYLVLYAKDTNLTLSNSGSMVRLLAPDGVEISNTVQYEKAKSGASWTVVSDIWAWSTVPTPGEQNSIVPIVPKTPAATTKKGTTKKTTTKAATSKKTTATQKSTDEPEREALSPLINNTTKLPLPKSVLAGVATLALLYMGYEYRYDIGNKIYQLRKYITSRRNARA